MAAPIKQMEIAHQDGSYAVRANGYRCVKVLVANVEATIAVPLFVAPNGLSYPAARVMFAANNDFWVNYDQTITAIPSGDETDGISPELNPVMRIVDDVTTLHLMAAQNTLVSLVFFRAASP